MATEIQTLAVAVTSPHQPKATPITVDSRNGGITASLDNHPFRKERYDEHYYHETSPLFNPA